MPFFKLNVDQAKSALSLPELTMNCQFAHDGSQWYVVIGGCAALRLDNDLPNALKVYLDEVFVLPNKNRKERLQSFDGWLQSQALSPTLSFWGPGGGSSGSYGHPALPTPPAPPPVIFGHCLFSTTTSNDSVFYRYEHFPKSRRVDASTLKISPGTFASPISENNFISSGFGAVARFALPSLLPAVYRYEIQPDHNTDINCGASVPLYGQAGGGVEIEFVHGANNRCSIADPVYIPPI